MIRLRSIGDMSQLSTAFNAPDGTFEIGELQPGTYGLQARDASGNEAFTPNVAAGTRGLRIELKRAGVIEGRLIGFASLPNVQALRLAPGQFFPPMRATVDGDRYRIEGVPPATWEVRTASAGAAATAVVPVEAGQTVHADLQNRGSATIAGRVVDFVSGAGLPGIRCVVGHSDGTHRATRFLPGEAWTDASGAFTIDPAPAGPCSVTCWGPSDVSDGIATFDLERGANGNATIPFVTSPRQAYASLGFALDNADSLSRSFSRTPVDRGDRGSSLRRPRDRDRRPRRARAERQRCLRLHPLPSPPQRSQTRRRPRRQGIPISLHIIDTPPGKP
ncbi:MAG TPA: carboxypeptidase-like regulatory domain-containing protein [Polyangiaceae bacterium]|nr:carboxypeptidase-like regulatory domain-containing protein [Polyangiaceae bacterium]